MKNKLPSKIVNSNKQGYLAPWHLVYQIIHGHLDLIRSSAIYEKCGYFDQKAVVEIHDQYSRGYRSDQICSQLLFVISTHQLHQTFFN